MVKSYEQAQGTVAPTESSCLARVVSLNASYLEQESHPSLRSCIPLLNRLSRAASTLGTVDGCCCRSFRRDRGFAVSLDRDPTLVCFSTKKMRASGSAGAALYNLHVCIKVLGRHLEALPK